MVKSKTKGIFKGRERRSKLTQAHHLDRGLLGEDWVHSPFLTWVYGGHY